MLTYTTQAVANQNGVTAIGDQLASFIFITSHIQKESITAVFAFLIYFKKILFLFYADEGFACMYVCASHMGLVP